MRKTGRRGGDARLGLDAVCPLCGSPAWALYAKGEDGRYNLRVGVECPIDGDVYPGDVKRFEVTD